MGDHHGQVGHRHIGDYLRGVRESRRLTLGAVEEMTGALPGSVTKSYLSRIENGRLEPTFPRLYALSQVYGVPIASFAEQFEVDMRRNAIPRECAEQPSDRLLRDAERRYREGCYLEALARVEALLDRAAAGDLSEGDIPLSLRRVRILRINCLIYLDRFHAAKEECESMMTDADISPADRALALYHFARCCLRMGKPPLALMAITTLERDVPQLDESVLSMGNLVSLRGNALAAVDDSRGALEAFREAVDLFDAAGDDLSACRHRMNYAEMLIDCGKPRLARKQLVAILADARRLHEARLIAFGLHGLGRAGYELRDLRVAESYFMESNRISRRREYLSLVFCNCYYLWRIATEQDSPTPAAAHLRTMRAYVTRVPENLPEARAFRTAERGGA